MNRALIVVPERDRLYQTDKLLKSLIPLLKKQEIEYTIVFVHQNNKYLFNRGMLFNIGVYLAKKNSIEYDYIILHDIDMYPLSEVDYTYSNERVLFECSILNYYEQGKCFNSITQGGVVIIGKESYDKANGFSNDFFGWGAEDDNFNRRCASAGIGYKLRTAEFETDLNLHGPNDHNYRRNCSILGITNLEDGLTLLNEVDECVNKNDFTCRIVEKSDYIIHYYVDFLYKNNNISLNCDKYFSSKSEIKLGSINGGHCFEKVIKTYLSKKYNISVVSENNLKECDVIVSSYDGNHSINDFKYTTYKIFASPENLNTSMINYNRNFDLIIGTINTNENIHAIEYVKYTLSE